MVERLVSGRGARRGGSHIAQRMLASRSEQDAVTGTLLFNVMHDASIPGMKS